MYKILAFILMIVLVLRGLGAVMRLLFGGNLANRAARNFQEGQNPRRKNKPAGGNVNVDYVPGKGDKTKKGFKGGEYVDYEDVQ